MVAQNYDELRNKECFLLDMDGTFYLGDELIEGADRFIEILEENNKEYIFLTNNSSRNAGYYRDKLKGMGIEIGEEKIISSGEVTAAYIREEKAAARVYVAGTPSLEEDLKEAGLQLVSGRKPTPDYVVLGFDTTLTYEKLWIVHDLILKGVTYIATNPDFVCPLENGRTMPDCGSIIELLKASTGEEPLVIGKPNTEMIDYITDKMNISQEKLCLVGDRLYTDIKTAINAGIDSVAVLTGETSREEIEKEGIYPDYIFSSIKKLSSVLSNQR